MIGPVTAAYKMLSKQGFADIMQNTQTGEKSLHTHAFFDKGELICAFAPEKILDTPSYLTLQIADHKHITLTPDFLQFTNHSCNPNVFFDTHRMELLALKEIQPGDELVFFYPSTEWEMDQPFECFCGSPQCLQHIQGAAFLSEQEAGNYQLTQYIQQKLQTKKTK